MPDTKFTFHVNNGYDCADSVKECGVRAPPAVPGRFKLNRSPTISFQDNGHSPPPANRFQLDPSSDEAESNNELFGEDKSGVSDSWVTQLTPETSPSPSRANEVNNIYATTSSLLLGIQDHGDTVRQQCLEDDESTVIVRIESRLFDLLFKLTPFSSKRIRLVIPTDPMTISILILHELQLRGQGFRICHSSPLVNPSQA